jgi:hypothetical protein
MGEGWQGGKWYHFFGQVFSYFYRAAVHLQRRSHFGKPSVHSNTALVPK